MGRKRRGRGPVVGGGSGALLQQVQKLQQKMLEVQEALGEETVTTTVGGGVISVVMTGQQKVRSITIDPSVVDAEDVEMLQDLIVAAVNQAVDDSRQMAEERLSAVTGGIKIPGLM
ncbi:MAG: YbaB/EbfC family nucleoid-associated protein [Anaerolineae bacterium]